MRSTPVGFLKTSDDLAKLMVVVIEQARRGGLDDGRIAYELIHADRDIYEEVWDMMVEVFEDLEPDEL